MESYWRRTKRDDDSADPRSTFHSAKRMGMKIAACAILATLMTCLTAFGASWAIVIGISNYKDAKIEDLRYAEEDARAFATALTSVCGVPVRNIITLYGRSATKKGIEDSFGELSRNVDPQDTVFIYYSGHGSFVRDLDGDEADGDHVDETLVPYDAEYDREETHVIDDVFGYWISRIPARSVIILLDSCHSGGQGKGMSASSIMARGHGDSLVKDIFTDSSARSGREVLAASTSGELAFEHPDLKHGVFTYFVLQGLEAKRADSNRDNQVTLHELWHFVSEGIEIWGHPQGIYQTPVFESSSSEELIIVPKSMPRSLIPSVSPSVSPVFGAAGRALASAIVPGLGQALNGDALKASIHLGGMLATFFLIREIAPEFLLGAVLGWSAFSALDAALGYLEERE